MPHIIYLILFILFGIVSFLFGFFQGLKYSNREIKRAKDLSNKHLELFKLAVRWIKNPQKIVNYLDENGYKRIGIYGMSYLGDCLQEVLRENDIKVVFGVDRNASRLYNPYIPIYEMTDDLPIVDVIIVTTIAFFPEIKQELEEKLDRHTLVISLEDILYQ